MAFPWLMNGGDPNYSQVLWMMVFKSFTIGEVQFSPRKLTWQWQLHHEWRCMSCPKDFKVFFPRLFFQAPLLKVHENRPKPKRKGSSSNLPFFRGGQAVSFRECKNYSLGNRWMAWVLPQLGFLSERLSASPGIPGIFFLGTWNRRFKWIIVEYFRIHDTGIFIYLYIIKMIKYCR